MARKQQQSAHEHSAAEQHRDRNERDAVSQGFMELWHRQEQNATIACEARNGGMTARIMASGRPRYRV